MNTQGEDKVVELAMVYAGETDAVFLKDAVKIDAYVAGYKKAAQDNLERESSLVGALIQIEHKIQFGFNMGHSHAMVKLEHCKAIAKEALISVGVVKASEL